MEAETEYYARLSHYHIKFLDFITAPFYIIENKILKMLMSIPIMLEKCFIFLFKYKDIVQKDD